MEMMTRSQFDARRKADIEFNETYESYEHYVRVEHAWWKEQRERDFAALRAQPDTRTAQEKAAGRRLARRIFGGK